MRIFSLGLGLILVACGDGDENRSATSAASLPIDQARAGGVAIDCALSGAASFAATCSVEKRDDTLVLLRHSDGGFRRITLAADGTIDAADGSERPLGKSLPDGRFELTLGNDRYRLPPKLM